MKTVPLSPNYSAPVVDALVRSTEAVLVGEIAERLVEWGEAMGRDRPARWLMRVAALAADDRSTDALLIYLRLSTGDLAQITASFSELGAKRARSKQGEQQEQERALHVIASHYPELKTAITELLQKHAPKE